MIYSLNKKVNDTEIRIEYSKSNQIDGGRIRLFIDNVLTDEWCPFNENYNERDLERISCPILDLIRDSLQDTYPEIANSKIWYDSDILNLQSVIDNDWKQLLIVSKNQI